MTQLSDLAGSYTLHPGAASSITGQRPILTPGLLTRMLRGQGTEQVVRLLGQLFALCAHAHRHTARLALGAALLPEQTLLPAPNSQQLALHTALDHLRHMTLDTPQPGLAWPTPCPLPLAQAHSEPNQTQAATQLAQLLYWLEHSVLQQPAADWLAQHQDPAALLAWCQRRAPEVAAAGRLASCHTQASVLLCQGVPLDVLDPDAQRQITNLQQLAQTLARDTSVAARPVWCGHPAETGPWTRLRQRLAPSVNSPEHTTTAWTRLASRWLDLVHICHAGASPHTTTVPLSSGALALGAGQAMAWCEMARGLLLHWVQLDTQGRIEAYQVVAPTEWNFHPKGSLAKALTQLAPENSTAAALLGLAFDACVACHVSPATTQETADA